jgi:hypothetical protein
MNAGAQQSGVEPFSTPTKKDAMLHHQHDEIAATAARQLSPAAQAAILAAAGGRLQRVARGWAANGQPAPIRHSIVQYLIRRGLMSAGDRTAILSITGKWYARTLARDLAATPQPNDEALA